MVKTGPIEKSRSPIKIKRELLSGGSLIRWFLSLSLMGFSAHGQSEQSTPTSTCSVFRSEEFRDQHFETRIGNCEKLMQSGDVPNAQALKYTLSYLAQNYKGLKDSNCAMDGLEKDVACAICKNPSRIRQGIQNGCSFVLNDLQRPWGDGTTRTTGYYIDLCQDAAGPSVQKFYVNVGTGTTKGNKYLDRQGAKTTVPGAFLTDDKISSFYPYNPDKYQSMKKNLGGILPSIRLVGLNNSNNSSEDSKPMHVSPFRSSSGCPSVGPQTVPIMKQLVQNGPALVMNYHSAQYEQKASCENDPTGNSVGNQNSGNGNSGRGVQ